MQEPASVSHGNPEAPSARLLSVADARNRATDALVACDTAPENARSVADALIGAELTGQTGHGLRRLPGYCAQLRVGKVDGRATPTLEQPRPGVLRIDAAAGFAYPALDLAVRELPAIARETGIAMAAIRRSHHAGALGLAAERLAAGGLLALVFANSPAAMAPWGAREPLLGTNPIAFSAPVAGAEAMVVDLSLSEVARGKVVAAAQQDAPIPEGWALDAAGSPTTDPEAALSGSMLPFGGAKGAALAIAVEALAAGLAGAHYAWEAASFLDATGPPPGVGQLVIAIDPDAGSPHAGQRFTALAERIGAAEGARLPGRRGQALRSQRIRDGLPVDAALLAEIAQLHGR